jgi:hypothetical protein
MNSPRGDRALPRPGCPIRRSPDQHLLSGSPELIAASHVLHRLLAPRHSPCALSSLTMFATGRPHGPGVQTQRLGELPRACSRTDGYPSRLSKNPARSPVRLSRRTDTAIPDAVRLEPHRASQVRENDGADGDRTHDLRLAKPALSQLSYSPEGRALVEVASRNGPEGRPEAPREVPRAYPLTSGLRLAPVPLLSSGCCPPLFWGLFV